MATPGAPLLCSGRLCKWSGSLGLVLACCAQLCCCLVSDRFFLTVPSSLVRTIDDPSTVTAFWDGVLDSISDLLGVSKGAQGLGLQLLRSGD